MAKHEIDLTSEQETALTAYLRADVTTIEEMVMKDYVGAVERAYKQKLVADADAKVATFTDESKEVIADFEEQKIAEKLALIATEEAKQPAK